jgi:hypothetical protein
MQNAQQRNLKYLSDKCLHGNTKKNSSKPLNTYILARFSQNNSKKSQK